MAHKSETRWVLKSRRTGKYRAKGLVAMNKPRHSFTLANFRNQKAYVCGGANDREILNIVERFDFTTRKWESVPCMTVARRNPSSCCLNSSLYVMCGTGYTYSNLNSIDKFTNNKWLNIMIPVS